MFTKWSQIEDWIRDNKLDRWIITKSDRNTSKSEGGTPNDKIADSEYYGQTLDEKIDLTRKMVMQYGCRLYGQGWQGKARTDGMYCEIQLDNAASYPTAAQAQGGVAAAPVDVVELEKKIRAQVMADIKAERLEEERKAFEREKREFERDKQSALGLLVGYAKPLIGAIAGRNVAAGLDSPADVHASRIVPVGQAAPQPVETEAESEEGCMFSDEEADKLFVLMGRFKQAEPQYMELLERVVEMAESGDAMYAAAKGVILK